MKTIKVIDIGSQPYPYVGKWLCVVCGKRKASVHWLDMEDYMECKYCYGILRWIWLLIKNWDSYL